MWLVLFLTAVVGQNITQGLEGFHFNSFLKKYPSVLCGYYEAMEEENARIRWWHELDISKGEQDEIREMASQHCTQEAMEKEKSKEYDMRDIVDQLLDGVKKKPREQPVEFFYSSEVCDRKRHGNVISLTAIKGMILILMTIFFIFMVALIIPWIIATCSEEKAKKHFFDVANDPGVMSSRYSEESD